MIFQTFFRFIYFSYLDLMLIHYPKADASSNDDPRNADHRKECYLALEKYKGIPLLFVLKCPPFSLFFSPNFLLLISVSSDLPECR